MSKSFIYCVNQSEQEVQGNGIVSPGSVIRRFGCNASLSGNGVEVRGDGYYKIDVALTLDQTGTGGVTASVLQDGVVVPGAIGTTTGTGTSTITIPTAIRLRCCADSASAITCAISGEATVTNYTISVQKL